MNKESEDLIKNLKENIFKLIKHNNMTCEEFGNALGYSCEDVDRILFGELLIPPVEIERIAKLLSTTKKELIYGEL